MKSYATITIELFKSGMGVTCDDTGEEIFIPREMEKGKNSNANALIDFINNVDDICDPDATFVLTPEGEKWYEEQLRKNAEKENEKLS